MLTDGTIDEEIYLLIERKRSVVNRAVDGGLPVDDVDTSQLLFSLMNM
jgi:SNF2 family DNA or RNA helicase